MFIFICTAMSVLYIGFVTIDVYKVNEHEGQ
jgi:hypothetical protein